MAYITSGECRRILSIEGRPINIRTFDNLVEAGLIKQEGHVLPNGTRLFHDADVKVLAKYMPKEPLPLGASLVKYLKERMGKRA